MAFDVQAIRRQFPIFSEKINGNPLVYLDNAATAQVPEAVLQAMHAYETTKRANAHRGMHVLAERATVAYEESRAAVAEFLGATPSEIVFTGNCTQSLNIIARSFGSTLKKGDTVVLSLLEHHSAIVPWLQLKEEKGIQIEWIDIDDSGALKMDELDAFLQQGNVKMVCVTGQSNVLGVRPPIEKIISRAHRSGALVTIDAAQLVAHHRVNVRELDSDFLTFSGHKLYGPTGIGVLYGKRKLLESLPPVFGGGGMIGSVSRSGFTPADVPQKFEAGSPPIGQAVGLCAAIGWLSQYAWKDIEHHESALIAHACSVLSKIPNIHILPHHESRTTNHASCISFTLPSLHPHDLTEILGQQGICMRAGHHCTEPLHKRLGIAASTRLSVGIYNTKDEIDSLPGAIQEAQKILA